MDYDNILGENGLSLTSVAKAIGISNQSLGQKIKGKNRQYLTYMEERKLLIHLSSYQDTLSKFLKERETLMSIKILQLKDSITLNLQISYCMNKNSVIVEQRPSSNEEKNLVIEYLCNSIVLDTALFPIGETEKDYLKEKTKDRKRYSEKCAYITTTVKGTDYKIIDVTDYSEDNDNSIVSFQLKYLLRSNGEVADVSSNDLLKNNFEDNLEIRDRLVNLISKGENNDDAKFYFSKLKEEKKSFASEKKLGKDYINYLTNLSIDEIFV